ncbi:hypothetical protein ACY3WP_002749 [Acinetobacter baumannii]|nr:hypothetical protein [Acinetobacter baumannii]EKW2952562.1 hypothetical protein [Acinetobacter baumannii]EKW7200334.1 hypothetical protein [Acinetobacter baumannii]EKX0521441.1 hypothetical protein [Acinetobacter baumannii]EKX0525054.1 hypothetical protein [Acinetobacter baumannii]
MEKLKIIVNDDHESLEVQGLLESIGYRKIHHWGNYKSPKKIMTNEDWYSDYTIDSDEYNSRKTITLPQLRDLVVQSKLKDQGLISGAEALRALADEKSIEWQDDNGIWWPLGVGWTWNQIVNSLNGIQALRLKPQTIKLELEIPAPFVPKHGEMYWWIDATSEEGYSYTYFDNNKADQDIMQFGAYRTEDDVKKAVEQLRKIRGTNS